MPSAFRGTQLKQFLQLAGGSLRIREQESRRHIVTTGYNASKFLSQTVASVLAQTYRDYELLIVDDGSSEVRWRSPEDGNASIRGCASSHARMAASVFVPIQFHRAI